MEWGKRLFTWGKVLVIIVSLVYIVLKLYAEKQNGIVLQAVKGFTFFHGLTFLGVFLLVFVNWGCESLKFKLLLAPVQRLSVRKSFEAVFAGISVSIFTPKRVGDFGGRIFVLDTPNRVRGIFASLLGNVSQLLITLIMGICMLPFYFSYNKDMAAFGLNRPWIFFTLALIIGSLLLIYFNVSKATTVLNRFSFFRKQADFIHFLQQYRKRDLFYFLLLSFFRYGIFSLQFFLLLKLYGLDLSYGLAMLGISQMYFLMTIIPTFAFGEIGVRGSVAVWVFSALTAFSSPVMATSVSLWIFNLALPALLGIYFLLKFKY